MSLLDNPIWNSLRTRHAGFASGTDRALRLPPDIAPFAAIPSDRDDSAAALRSLIPPGDTIAMIGTTPDDLAGWQVLKRFDVLQYVWPTVTPAPADPRIRLLGEEFIPAMVELTALVYPAYFRAGTVKLGPYYGIVEDGRLCAMAGVRLSMDGFQEVSGVCTHPDSRGKGYAGLLTRHVADLIVAAGDVAFLHTEDDNLAAQSIYGKMGFQLRCSLPVQIMERLASG